MKRYSIKKINNTQEGFKSNVESIGGAIEFSSCRDVKKTVIKQKHSAVIAAPQSLGELQTLFPDAKINELSASEIRFPLKDFNIKHMTMTPEFLRIYDCTPRFDGNEVVYSTTDPRTIGRIYHEHEKFVARRGWSHFACLPISPVFPNFMTLLRQQIPNICDDSHITLTMLSVTSDDEMKIAENAFIAAVAETKWPDDLSLTFPKLGCFGSPSQCRILFLELDGQLSAALRPFQLVFANKMRDNGICYMEVVQELHVTIMRPPGRRRDFDATSIYPMYSPLPAIKPNELRIVKRFENDPDGFWRCIVRSQITPAPALDT